MNEQPKHNPGADPPAAAASEAEYLRTQAADASAAISSAFAAFKADLAGGVDPRAWAHQHPWVAVGAAAVAGFTAASALVPSKEAQAIKKLERIERALHAAPPPGPRGAERGAAAESSHGKSLTSRLVAEAFSALKPALSSVLAAYAAASSSGHSGNGHSPAADDPHESGPDPA